MNNFSREFPSKTKQAQACAHAGARTLGLLIFLVSFSLLLVLIQYEIYCMAIKKKVVHSFQSDSRSVRLFAVKGLIKHIVDLNVHQSANQC